MVTIKDVAAYVLQKTGRITTMKLQKLVYYSQAWHVTWTDKKLFNEQFQAWANGPVAPALFDAHRGQYMISGMPEGDPTALNSSQRATVDAIVRDYGSLSGAALSALTHSEPPWLDARGHLPSAASSSTPITTKAMKRYYGSLDDSNAESVADLTWPTSINW